MPQSIQWYNVLQAFEEGVGHALPKQNYEGSIYKLQVRFSPGYGTAPFVKISYKRIPKLQTSDLIVNFFNQTLSGEAHFNGNLPTFKK